MSTLLPWGKARRIEGSVAPYHPAVYHCLDVAACALVLLECLPLLRKRLGCLLNVNDPTPLLVALVALHDIGKLSRAFQQKANKHWLNDIYGDIGEAPEDPGHGTSGFYLWRDILCNRFEDGEKLLPLARSIYGHHGSPVCEAREQINLRNIFGRCGIKLAETFADEVIELLEPGTIGRNANLEHASWLVAGLTVLADWIGSSQEWFPYAKPNASIADYWERTAKPQARSAVSVAGVIPALATQSLTYPQMTSIEAFDPTPMQVWVMNAHIEPGLYIIEDSTGAGKTEAAVMLAHRIMAAGLADGLYVALPTMATADGMFDRMGDMYRKLFADTTTPSLALAHGARDLHEGFQSAIRIPDPDTGNFAGAKELEDVSFCNAWIADDRRKTFLAQVGVGTVDQALLSILPSFHQSLRVLGLSQRVLILDEVHAYDSYMNQEILRLLEMQAALGGTTILLSATLPDETKARLLRAYGGTVNEFSQDYPLATFIAARRPDEIVLDPVAPRGITVRSVPLSFVTTPEAGLRRAVDAARAGQAVLYIRNTVRDAIETFDAIPAEITPHLFHARFAMCDRQRIQDDALRRFGKKSGPNDRNGHFLVATQVVEQSLDLDFDLIVSDLAPIDLIIQRAGRLWRHERDDRPASAVREMVIVGPEPIADADANWLERSLRMTDFVYSDTGRMWLTAEALRNAGEIATPDGLRPLIEHVYGSDPEQRTPTGLHQSLGEALMRSGAERAAAVSSMLTVNGGYVRAEKWDTDERVMTRLGDPTTTLRLAVSHNGRITPWAGTPRNRTEDRRLWALSEVRISVRRQCGLTVPANLAEAEVEAKALWSKWQQDEVVLVVVDDDGSTPGNLRYDRVLGLTRIND